jgi:hypothetical protein
MKSARNNVGMIIFTLLAVVLVVAVIHLAGQATGTPDQVGGGTATYNPWSATPAAVVSTHTATATPDSGAGEPEDGGGDGGGDG